MVPFGQKLSIGTTPNTAIEIEDPDRFIYSILSKYDGEYISIFSLFARIPIVMKF
jgi:hypothetical protein